jgi:hypothetical protein
MEITQDDLERMIADAKAAAAPGETAVVDLGGASVTITRAPAEVPPGVEIKGGTVTLSR